MKKESIGILNLLAPEELAAAVLLYEHPLYRYANEKKELSVLLVGPEPMDERLDEWKLMNSILRLTLACGQVLNHTLRVYVAAKNAAAYKKALLEKAPALEKFLCIDGKTDCERPLAFLNFEDVKGINSPAGNRKLFAHLEDCSYVVAALKEKNDVLVKALCQELCGREGGAVLAYTGEKVTPKSADKGVKLCCLKELAKKSGRTVERLGEMAFRQHYYYCQQGSPTSWKAAREEFLSSPYEQSANLSSVVHIKYKLFSMGINPNARAKTILAKYTRALENAELLDELSDLEHSRWMAEKLLDGYRPAQSAKELELYCFTDGNNRWRTGEFHNCLVSRRRRAESDLSTLPHADWELEGDLEAQISRLPYDELDKMSLLVHNLARKKLAETKEQLKGEIGKLEEKAGLQRAFLQTPNPLPKFQEWIELVTKNMQLRQEKPWLEALRQYCDSLGLSRKALEPLQKHLKTLLALAREYYRFKDYKTMDEDIVRLLPELYCRPEYITLVKLPGRHVVDQIVSALLIEPDKVVYAGAEGKEAENYRYFLENRGGFAEVETVAVKKLKKTICSEAENGLCVLDVTGADAALAVELVEYAKTRRNTAVINCDSKRQKLQNLYEYPLADCTLRSVRLTVEEVFSLMGARKRRKGGEYDGLFLKEHITALWEFYEKYYREFDHISNMICAAVDFTAERNRTPGFFFFNREAESISWLEEKETGSLKLFEDLALEQLLRDMEQYGIVQNLRIEKNAPGNTVQLSYRIIADAATKNWRLISLEFKRDIYKPVVLVNTETTNKRKETCFQLRWKSAEDNKLYVSCECTRGEDDTLEIGSRFLPRELWRETLEDLTDKGLIYGLSWYERDKVYFSFFFASELIMRMFKTTGNFLEMKVWSDAVDSGKFDDVMTNFQFWWNEEQTVENELDVVMTKGTELEAISCKIPRPLKSHLYEVDSVARHFSASAQAAMVYSFDPSKSKETPKEEDWHGVFNRAAELNVLVANVMDSDHSLKQLLEQLAE